MSSNLPKLTKDVLCILIYICDNETLETWTSNRICGPFSWITKYNHNYNNFGWEMVCSECDESCVIKQAHDIVSFLIKDLVGRQITPQMIVEFNHRLDAIINEISSSLS